MNKQEYMRKYYYEHKEQFKNYNKIFLEKNPDYKKEYYQKNKERIYELQTKYRKKNSKKISEQCHQSRKRRVERLKAEGCINAWSVVVHQKEPKYK